MPPVSNRLFSILWVVALAADLALWSASRAYGPQALRYVMFFAAVFGFAGLMLAGGMRATRQSGKRVSPAAVRYLWRFMPSMMAYIVVLFSSLWLYQHVHLTGALAYLVAISPAIPVLGAIWAIGMFMAEEEDEFHRKMMIESYLWATGATLAVCTGTGFLQTWKLAPDIPLWAVFPLLAICLFPAQAWVRWKYR